MESFQSIAATKKWRLLSLKLSCPTSRSRFQSIAATKKWRQGSDVTAAENRQNRFQSIAATKKWRRSPDTWCVYYGEAGFQSIAATKKWRPTRWPPCSMPPIWFPINSRHQEVATPRGSGRLWRMTQEAEFPINSRHQEVATLILIRNFSIFGPGFPINSRHQEVATCRNDLLRGLVTIFSFQSIAATKKWRH